MDFKLDLDKNYSLFLRTEDNSDKQLDRLFKILANRENDLIRPKTLTIKERNVTFNKTCGRLADCTFDELCDRVRHDTILSFINF